MVLTPDALTMNNVTIAKLENDQLKDFDPDHPKGSNLYRHLSKANQLNSEDQDSATSVKHIVFFCDRNLPFHTINSIVKTAALAGFPNFQFMVMEK